MDDPQHDDRLKSLYRYNILDTPPEEAHDRLTEMAAEWFGVPTALIALIDEDRQWFKSTVGFGRKETSLSISFCTYTVDAGTVTVIEDAREDERFADNPLVTGDPYVRFYAGAPLETPDGYRLGTFAILDSEPRSLSEKDRHHLQQLAAIAVDELELRRESQKRKWAERQFEAVFHDPNILVSLLAPDGRVLDMNEGMLTHINATPEDVLQNPFWDISWFTDQTAPDVKDWVERAAQGEYVEFELDLPHEQSTDAPCTIQGVFRPVPGDTDEVASILVSARDISNRKIAEQRLQKQKDQFHSIAENVADGIYRTDRETGQIIYANRALAEMFGYERPETFKAVDPAELYADPAEREKLFEQLKTEGSFDGLEIKYRRKDGSTFTGLVNSTIAYDEHGTPRYHDGAVTDISAQKKQEQILREREQELAEYKAFTDDIINAVDDVFYVLDQDGYLVRWNDKLSAVTGYSDAEIETMHGTDFFAEADQPRIATAIRAAFTEGHVRVEAPFLTKTGDSVPHEFVADRLEDLDGQLVLAGIGRDITERKKTERALRKRERQLRGLADSIPGVLFQFYAEPDGTREVRYASDRTKTLLGLSPDADDLFQQIADRIPAPHQETFLRSIAAAAEDKQPTRLEFPYERAGEERWFLVAAHPEEVGEALIFNGVLLDITERKKAERARRILAAAVEQADESVCITEATPLDPPGPRITYVNPAFASMTGYAEDELLGRTPRILQGPDTDRAVLDRLRARLEAGKPFEGETINYRKDGTSYIPHWTIAPVHGKTGEVEHWVSVQRDVTEEREREAALRKAKDEAERASRLKSAFLANMSHEIRTPLTSMIGFSEVLQEMDIAADAQEAAALIHRSSGRLLRTLESVLALSQLEAGTRELRPSSLNLRVLIHEIVTEFRLQADEAGIALEALLPLTPVPAVLDKGALERILSNLLNNAIKFTNEGGTIRVELQAHENEIRIDVEDTGIGIDPDFMSDLFEPYHQESSGLARNYEGAGLGLTIVERLTRALGGEVNAQSEKGVGTQFTVVLPRHM